MDLWDRFVRHLHERNVMAPFSRFYRAMVLKMNQHEDEATTSGLTDGAPLEQNRLIFINRPQPIKFINNRISTAKYSVPSFIPLFLFEQFRRYSNCFFLLIALLQQIPDVSPTGRWTTLTPLILILSVSALKEIVEDFKRHRADDETNRRKVDVLREGRWVTVLWEQMLVGDICKVVNNQFFPADIIMLSSSEPQGISFIETSNLDGETNLKIRQAHPDTARLDNTLALTDFTATVQCEQPNRHLYEFNGLLKESSNKVIPLGLEQMLLRGSMLRNTNYIYGVVVYTGHETKLMKNSTKAPLKRSSIDRQTNTHILMLFLILLTLSLLSAGCNEYWMKAHQDWYLGLQEYTIRSEWLTAAKTLGSAEHGIVGVAGYHFHPRHLIDRLESITNFPCNEDEECHHRCDGTIWSCVLIDEYGWIAAREGRNITGEPDEPLTEHFATVFPTAMKALLNASVFEMNWIHDYQGVCFPPKDEPLSSAVTAVPSILLSIWRSVSLVLLVTQEMISLITILSTGCLTLASGDTEQEKQKRKKRLWRDYEREKYETLYDDRVLVNRTRFAACDRSRVLYVLQDTPKAQEALKRPPKPCTWPLVAARVPKTNLLLVAVYNPCKNKGKPVNDPLVNEQYLEVEPDMKGYRQSSASKLACWRNRVPLPTRPPHVKCYPHNYAQESGYRQCGPWLPDPEEEDASSHITASNSLLSIILVMFLIKHYIL